jgi:hypothetical protein
MSIYKPEDDWKPVRRAKRLPAVKRYVGLQAWLKALALELGSRDILADWETIFTQRNTHDDPVYQLCLKIDRAIRAKDAVSVPTIQPTVGEVVRIIVDGERYQAVVVGVDGFGRAIVGLNQPIMSAAGPTTWHRRLRYGQYFPAD